MNAVEIVLATADETYTYGLRLATLLQAGDLVILTGDLGAGKTTLTKGIGAGLNVRGPIASPTFVIARSHPALETGPDLVHVDAYRLGSLDEVDALDLDTDLSDSVTVVEWGAGLVEALSTDRLEICLARPRGATNDSEIFETDNAPRVLRLEGFGLRWTDVKFPQA